MEKFQLSLLFKIIGIGSASGLVYHDEKLYLISDNSTFLYEYHIPTESLDRIKLAENAQESIIKKEKPDFEAIAKKGNDLVIIGSGSTENRNRIFRYNINSKKATEKSFSELYSKIKAQLGIKDDELNIEGLIIDNDKIYFFQRGNGANSKNGIISATDQTDNINFTFTPVALPKIKNIETTFTDAVSADGKIYFLASAEDTASTYLDGEVLGSIIGCMDAQTFKVEFTQQISGIHKFEGLTLYRQSATQMEFLLCEDKDNDHLETIIYKLVLEKNQ